jgi:hypothetical protein
LESVNHFRITLRLSEKNTFIYFDRTTGESLVSNQCVSVASKPYVNKSLSVNSKFSSVDASVDLLIHCSSVRFHLSAFKEKIILDYPSLEKLPQLKQES